MVQLLLMEMSGMDKIQAVMNRFPQNAYDQDNQKSVLYAVVKAIIDEFNITMDNIDRINKMLDINNILPDDIYNRFGALLNINRNPNETDEQYRSRLKTSMTALSGGTAAAIKYAIACGLGINGDNEAMDKITIYDAWEYDGEADVIKENGYVVCSVDLNNGTYSTEIEQAVKNATNNVKAAGVIMQFVYYNFRIMYYTELDNITYTSLSTLTYSQVGE